MTFFIVRLVWGTIQTVAMYRDIWTAYTTDLSREALGKDFRIIEELQGEGLLPSRVPFWLALWTTGANGVLCCLNVFWFGKIVGTMRQKLSK